MSSPQIILFRSVRLLSNSMASHPSPPLPWCTPDICQSKYTRQYSHRRLEAPHNTLDKRKWKGKQETDHTKSFIREANTTSLSHGDQFHLPFETLKEKDVLKNKLGRLILGEKLSRVRRRSNTIILEGTRLIKDALMAGAEAECLCFCQPDVIQQLEGAQSHLAEVKLYQVSPKTMKMFSDTVTPGGLLGVFKKPQQGEAVRSPKSILPISIIFDSLKDPGNAGTLIRTAAAIGCEGIFAMEGCVNLWERKVLRSAMGAHFNVPIYNRVSWAELGDYLGRNTQVLLADSHSGHTLGETGHTHVGGDMCSMDTKSSESENELLSSDFSQTAENNLSESGAGEFSLPLYLYSEVQLTPVGTDSQDGVERDRHIPAKIALVVGSEAAGLSTLAKKFAFDRCGAYITIPMNETTNSLNSGIAGSIIMYELRKKLLQLR